MGDLIAFDDLCADGIDVGSIIAANCGDACFGDDLCYVPLQVYTVTCPGLLFQTNLDLAGSVCTKVDGVEIKQRGSECDSTSDTTSRRSSLSSSSCSTTEIPSQKSHKEGKRSKHGSRLVKKAAEEHAHGGSKHADRKRSDSHRSAHRRHRSGVECF